MTATAVRGRVHEQTFEGTTTTGPFRVRIEATGAGRAEAYLVTGDEPVRLGALTKGRIGWTATATTGAVRRASSRDLAAAALALHHLDPRAW